MKTRLLLVGGFLGAGKTTLLSQAAHILMRRGYRVGIVTNDQGHELVDTALVRQQHIPVAEVAGGCFCCRFPDLLESIQALEKAVQPDIVLAEPVGSCTDLVATVLRPLAKYYAGQFELAPLTVLLDPTREVGHFPSTVMYLYQQQLLEADIIALNKSDLLRDDQKAAHEKLLRDSYPAAQSLSLSARNGDGVAVWLDQCLNHVSRIDQNLDVDYDRYAEAEAVLGWLNAGGHFSAPTTFAPDVWMETVLGLLEQALVERRLPVAHVKMVAKAHTTDFKASLTHVNKPLSWDSRPVSDPVYSTTFILNARVKSAPAELEWVVRENLRQAAQQLGGELTFTHFDCFSPARPEPTHRMTIMP